MRKIIFIALVFVSVANAKCEFEDCTSFVKNITNQFLNEFENAIFGDLKKLKEVYDFLKKCGTYYLATVEGEQPRAFRW